MDTRHKRIHDGLVGWAISLGTLLAVVILVVMLCRGISSAFSQVAHGPVFNPPTAVPPTLTQQLGVEIRGHFTHETTFDYTNTDLTVTVPNFPVSTAYNLKTSVGDFFKWAYTTSWVPFDRVDVVLWANLRDAYGQTHSTRIAYALLTRSTANKFNWDQVYYQDAWKLYDQTLLNPAVT